MAGNASDRENNKPGSEKGVIGVRQEYKRDGKEEEEADAMDDVPGKPSTPYPY